MTLAATLGCLITVGGCSKPDQPAPAVTVAPQVASAPAPVPAARPGRPATLQGTLLLEGAPSPFSFALFESSALALPVAFSTYVPQDLVAEPAGPGPAQAVRFTANLGGVRQDQAYLEVAFLPPATTPADAQALIEKTAPGGAPLQRVADGARQFGWSLSEYAIGYRAKGKGSMAGVIALGRHRERLFQVTLHYPLEYADGFLPRAVRMLDEWRWADTQQGL